jgi:hypothetical protein
MGEGLAPVDRDNSAPINHRETAVRPSLAAARWAALDLQTLRRVRPSRAIMKSGSDQREISSPLAELLKLYLELKELRAKVTEAELRASQRGVSDPEDNVGDEL